MPQSTLASPPPFSQPHASVNSLSKISSASTLKCMSNPPTSLTTSRTEAATKSPPFTSLKPRSSPKKEAEKQSSGPSRKALPTCVRPYSTISALTNLRQQDTYLPTNTTAPT